MRLPGNRESALGARHYGAERRTTEQSEFFLVYVQCREGKCCLISNKLQLDYLCLKVINIAGHIADTSLRLSF